ncbi:myo-inositol catabolism protein IolC [Haloactinopolyspora alba]|uniref:Myo-inositol catabolism protein IolC n=1 Tax=Haloactinopolyspora alba TaxID=648780 RepID=A0A2P8E987_9ACTN|nr:DUF2090 domain-containing protein [Haloactinopolyspora alba]PSL06040.1 myo-inositol catabolism protein IolC [Haloactinopolyspora alba]
MNPADLLMLAVDQRPWLTHALYGHTRRAAPDERAAICRGKHMVLDGLLAAVDGGVDSGVASESAAILVDDALGPGVAERARDHGVTLSMPLERGGLDVYEDEPDDVAAYLAHHRPDLAKVLVRYNPDGDPEVNALQRRRLAATERAAHEAGCRFLFELLVPPTPAQLESAGDRATFDEQLRPALILRGMEELGRAMAVDVWKLEQLGAEPNYADAVELAASTGGECILLGAGATAEQVDTWLTAAGRQGFGGFAIGRSVWWEAMRGLLAGEVDHETATARVAAGYTRFVATFRNSSTSPGTEPVPGVV